MDAREIFEAVCRAMNNPSFYPHPVTGLKRLDTHISTVFLTGQWVYKLKKPVELGFLDFRTLSDRRRFCELEVTLNRRLAGDVYQAVVPIRRDKNGTFSLSGKGPAVEYAVKMKQLPDEASLKALLEKNKIKEAHIQKLARLLADFYSKSDRSSSIDQFGRKIVISTNMEENFRQLEPFVGMAVEPDKWEFIREVSRVFLKNHAGLFESRIKAGRIRDGHGDLKAEHIYFHQGLKIIDCIEFNDRFRYGDAILDLAFLHMELERYGHPEWSDTLIAAYVDRADDPQAYNLLDLYAAYRAVVGLKVACLRIKEGGAAPALTDEARSCLNLAYRYAIQFSRPSLWVFCGLPASGKSSLARRAAEALFMPCLQSDRLRKQSSSPIREVVDFGQGSYSLGKRAHLYAMMLGQAHDILKKGRSVALDATFSSIKWRDEARQLASDLDTNIIFAECRCREKTTTARLKARENRPGLSDARLRNFNQIKDNYEPMTELPPETHLLIDTDLTPRESFLNVLAGGHRLKREQVAERLKRI